MKDLIIDTIRRMSVKIGFFLILLLSFYSFSLADTIYLKSGKVIDGKIVEVTNEYIKIDVEDVIVTFFKEDIKEVSLPKDNNSQLTNERQKVLEFLDKSDSIVVNMNREVSKKILSLQNALATGNKQEGYRIEEQIRDLISVYRKQMESLDSPYVCEEIKSIYIRWLKLQEEQHDALSKGDVRNGKLIALQVVEYFNKLKIAMGKLIQHYKR